MYWFLETTVIHSKRQVEKIAEKFFDIHLERKIIPNKTYVVGSQRFFFFNFRFLLWKRLLKFIIKRNITMIIYIDRLALNYCMFLKDMKGKLFTLRSKKNNNWSEKKRVKDMKQYQKKKNPAYFLSERFRAISVQQHYCLSVHWS